MERACIYCGAKEDLSESDIIPDALTNAKIINPNVCRVEHNNKFSDMFEDEIIKSLALITNKLDIKSSKGKKYAVYDAQITVAGTEYSTKMSSEVELFRGNKIISTEDGKTKLGPLEQIRKFKNANYENVTEVDVNQIEIEKKVTFNAEVFFSMEMHRLMAKIAFEWYCLHNGVKSKINAFDDIIEFITSGQENDPVRLVSNESIYNLISSQTGFGSHVILSYLAEDNSVNVMISLFGIAIYNVRILNKPIEPCKNNAVFQQVAIDAKREQFCFENWEELHHDFQNSFNVIPGLQVNIPKNRNDTSLHYKCMYIVHYELFQKKLNCIDEPNPEVVELLKNQLENILQAAALTVRGLKRFVKEHKEYLNQSSELNPKGSNKKSLFLYYILFAIGKSDGRIQNLQDLNTYIKQQFSGDSINISDELSKKLHEEVLSTNGYFEIIKKGAVAVETWGFD